MISLDKQAKVAMSSLLDEYKKNERIYERTIKLLEDKIKKLEEEIDDIHNCGGW